MLLMTSHDIILCVSEFVLFHNIIIFVLLFDKTAKLLLSIIIWVEKANDSPILVTSLYKDKMLYSASMV